MLFNSYLFVAFFFVVLLVYAIIPRKLRYLWLLLASYCFYMGWNPVYALLMAFSTIVTYLSGRLIHRAQNTPPHARCSGGIQGALLAKTSVIGSFTLNLSILFFFKYFYFALDNLNAAINLFHLPINPIVSSFDVILPVGISFYTFQALSYTVDVYRKEIRAEKNLLRYALFVSFFPQLVAGPIERSKNLLEQVVAIDKKKLWDYNRITSGFVLMLWGFFQKMVIADRISILVNTIFDEYYRFGTIELAIGAIGFALQIYCDFASYSTIAIGAAQVMGFSLMENFDTPYFSMSVRDFWRRWHISLSTWFRDYLYIPLGGNRKGKARKWLNLMITFLASGLWHGASWNFVAWGGIHGAYQVIGDWLAPLKQKFNHKFKVQTQSFGYRFGQVLCTFVLIDLAWVFFRSDSLRDAFLYLKALFTRWNPWVLFDASLYELGLPQIEWNILVYAVIVLGLVDLAKRFTTQRVDTFLAHQPLVFRWSVLFGLMVSIFLFGKYGPDVNPQAFIYFQF